MSDRTPFVTIAVLSWNRLHYLRATLESARRCIRYPNVEWIVSDNNSCEPGLREYIESLDWVQHKWFRTQSHADAMNEIVDRATGKYLILWPEDVQFIVEGEWLEDLVEIAETHPNLGSINLDALRRSTLQAVFRPSLRRLMPRLVDDFVRYRGHVRRARRIVSTRGLPVRTTGCMWPGICGSGIPSLTPIGLWRKLGPWVTRKHGNTLKDSSMGAEEHMYNLFAGAGLPLQLALSVLPVAADIITDPTGCKAKVRGRYRYGVYMPSQSPEGLFYRIRQQNEFTVESQDLPFSFSDMVEPLGFRIPLDEQGDRLKSAINTSVVFDIPNNREVKNPLLISS